MRSLIEGNILVISDLHLGEDLRPGVTNVSYLRHLAKLERELEAFLAHHTTHREGGRPWTLVVNGDMVDFMSVMILPDGAKPDPADHHDEEDRLYGLGFGEKQSQKKLEQVIVRHKGVFRRLAEFVHAGNELVIVVGNHDPEFYYESVQRTLVEWLCGLAVGAGAEDEQRITFAARIQFCPWFYYQENLIYVEHGHQYDEYCSFDYLLQPVTKDRGGRKSGIALSVAHAGMRYFASQIADYNPHNAERWSMLDYVRWALTLGLRGALRLCYLYGMLVWKVVEIWYALRHADLERRAVHGERLKALSDHWKIAHDKLLALDGLRRAPVTRRLGKLLGALFFDRVLMGMVTLIASVVLAMRLPGWWAVWVPFAVLLGFAVLNQVLNRLRLTPSSLKLRATTQLIQGLVCAPFIVFGHSHAPERVPLRNGGTYFNTGTWASDDESHAFTHLVVTRVEAASPHAELRQWRNGASCSYQSS
jgi:UDP-2,3-diacylglucosamine pyrophosphatase LpxH